MSSFDHPSSSAPRVRSRRRTVAGVLLGTAIGAACSVGLGIAGAAGPSEPSAERPAYLLGEAPAAPAEFSGAVIARYSALSAARGGAPAELRALVPNGGGLGANLDAARALQTVSGTAYAFPAAHDGVCLATRNWDPAKGAPTSSWGVGCTAGAAGSQDGVFLRDVDDEGAGVSTVLVPSGAVVERVSRAGTATRVAVVDGVASVRLAAGESLAVRAG